MSGPGEVLTPFPGSDLIHAVRDREQEIHYQPKHENEADANSGPGFSRTLAVLARAMGDAMVGCHPARDKPEINPAWTARNTHRYILRFRRSGTGVPISSADPVNMHPPSAPPGGTGHDLPGLQGETMRSLYVSIGQNTRLFAGCYRESTLSPPSGRSRREGLSHEGMADAISPRASR